MHVNGARYEGRVFKIKWKEAGKMINKMGKGSNPGLITQNTKGKLLFIILSSYSEGKKHGKGILYFSD